MLNKCRELDLSIIIANWNTGNYLTECVKSIYEKTQGLTYEIIIVDNASTDNSLELIDPKLDNLQILKVPVNYGFGKANNLGLKTARGKWICFLNPDTVLMNNAFSVMLNNKSLKTGTVKAIGPKILNADMTVQKSCARKLPGPCSILYSFTGLERVPFFPSLTKINCMCNYGETVIVPALSGACILIGHDTMKEIKGFDENYFMYGEDLDICYALKSRGYKILYTPEAELMHYGGISSKQISVAMAEANIKSYYYYLTKNHNPPLALMFFAAVKLIYLLRIIVYAPGALFFKGYRDRLKLFAAILNLK